MACVGKRPIVLVAKLFIGVVMGVLSGKRGLIVGVANGHSIAAGCAEVCAREGAELALTYLNEKAKPFVSPVAESVGAKLLLPLDVKDEVQMDAVFAEIDRQWGKLDFLIHSIAFCGKEDLHGRVVDCSRAGFAQTMDVSVHSLMRLVKRAEPLMVEGGSVVTMSYYGAEKVVDHYNIMGPVKAALESSAMYLAAELGGKGIRVNVVSSGPVMTRAGSGIDHFDAMLDAARERAPAHRLVTIQDVGEVTLSLLGDGAKAVTGNVVYVDAGLHIMA
jgi:enoyl-[acyl-carrier protein] reductase I